MKCTIISDGSELLFEMKNESEQPYIGIKFKLRETIWQLYCEGYDEFYLNCEYGIPLWSAEIICGLKMYNEIKLHIVIPYEKQPLSWIEVHRDRYFNVHSTSDTVVMMNAQYHSNCYQETDETMLMDSDLLVVFGNGQNKLDAIKLAKEKNIKVCFYKIPE